LAFILCALSFAVLWWAWDGGAPGGWGLRAKGFLASQAALSSSYLFRPPTFAAAKATLRGASRGVSERAALLLSHKRALLERLLRVNGAPPAPLRLAVENGYRPWGTDDSAIPWNFGLQNGCPVSCSVGWGDPLQPPDAVVSIEPCFFVGTLATHAFPGKPVISQMVENYYHGPPQGGDLFAYGSSEASLSAVTKTVAARSDYFSSFELDSDVVRDFSRYCALTAYTFDSARPPYPQVFLYISYVRAVLRWKAPLPATSLTSLRYRERIPAIAVFISNCHASNMVPPRASFILELSMHYTVHHFGDCSDPLIVGGQRGPLPPTFNGSGEARFDSLFPGALETDYGAARNAKAASKLAILSAYRYAAAFENSVGLDYVTEKVYDAFAAGAVPLYLGAPNVVDFLPSPASIINTRAFPTMKALAANLRALDRSEERWLQHHAWRTKPPPAHFQDLQFVADYHNVTLACRICACVMGVLCPGGPGR
jgi:hypothetical protein